MAQLYDISFESKVETRRYGPRKQVTVEKTTRPIVMTALPYATAMSYNALGVENFQISPHQEDRRYSSKGSGRPAGVGNGHRHVSRSTAPVVAKKAVDKNAARVAAAASGNLTAAINA